MRAKPFGGEQAGAVGGNRAQTEVAQRGTAGETWLLQSRRAQTGSSIPTRFNRGGAPV